MPINSKIAILATGDEIITGDILNTNTQKMAQALQDNRLTVGWHMTTPDDDSEIEIAIHFLLQQHDALIITGGLGPTSDDRTRFALANAIEEPLAFIDSAWDNIVQRLQSFKLTVPDSNRQQALFPKEASIIPNPRGTAAGCMVWHQGKMIFMLPGPPGECLPMFLDVVLPQLIDNLEKNNLALRKWRLFGVGESHIAHQLDAIIQDLGASTGYRIDYPYIEFKVFFPEEKATEQLWQQVHHLVDPYLLSHHHLKASELLVNTLCAYDGIVAIDDHATGGRLASTILKPSCAKALVFRPLNTVENASLSVEVTGLKELWEHKTTPGETQLNLTFFNEDRKETQAYTLPFRHSRVLNYAVELICHEILQRLGAIKHD